jgi:thiamine phosphate synthase YjbQ (UPF0047 family)
MEWQQMFISLAPKTRGCHLVTNEILNKIPALEDYSVGLAHFFCIKHNQSYKTCYIGIKYIMVVQHSSASITINENADPTVRSDMEMMLNKIAPEVPKGLLIVFELLIHLPFRVPLGHAI